ncbi:MAG: hypothetical protein JO362_14005 [Streptomycetaceae bacterium]|nr:hypothetical protein [Streptomycetaceae bacterium]
MHHPALPLPRDGGAPPSGIDDVQAAAHQAMVIPVDADSILEQFAIGALNLRLSPGRQRDAA